MQNRAFLPQVALRRPGGALGQDMAPADGAPAPAPADGGNGNGDGRFRLFPPFGFGPSWPFYWQTPLYPHPRRLVCRKEEENGEEVFICRDEPTYTPMAPPLRTFFVAPFWRTWP